MQQAECITLQASVMHREYNDMVASVADEVAEMKKVQAKSMAVQMQLDEQSLKRLADADDAKKVSAITL